MTSHAKQAPVVLVSRFLDSVGDGSGTSTIVGTYGTATEFKFVPEDGDVFTLTRLIVSIVDTVGADADAYGNNITLTNGIHLVVKDAGGTIMELTDPSVPVKTNGDWAHYCHDLTAHTFGSGNDHITARWTFSKSGMDIILDGNKGVYIAVIVEDDFQGLLEHRFLIQGHSELPFES